MPAHERIDEMRRADVLAVVIDQRDKLIRAVCAATGLDAHAAEDVVQDVTEKVLVSGRAPKQGESWLSYMSAAAVNRGHNVRVSAERTAAREATFGELTGADAAVDTVAARTRWLDALQDLEGLPESGQRCFVLRHYMGYTYAEIAEATGLDEDAVDYRLRQAAEKLRKLQEQRERSPAYVLLASLGARFTRRAPLAVTAPGAVAMFAAFGCLSAVCVVPFRAAQPPLSQTSRTGVIGAPVRVELSSRAGDDPPAGRVAGRSWSAGPLGAARPAHSTRLVVGQVPNSQRCVSSVCGGVQRGRVSPSGEDRVYVKVPGVGHPATYYYVETTGVPSCDYVPDTPVSGCVPGRPGASPRPLSES